MGMDVYGKNPSSEEGKYFRANVWGWRPLADYVQALAPDICSACEYWQSNDGDGLDAEASLALAEVLDAEISSGRAEHACILDNGQREAMANVECEICGGTGKRQKPPGIGPGDVECNGCDSTGFIRPFDTHYGLTFDRVTNFAKFLRHCGGFEIC